MGDEENRIRDAVVDAFILSAEAQLHSLRRLRRAPAAGRAKPRRVGMSQVDFVEDILRSAGQPLHVTEIIGRVEQRHGQRLDRESIVSALTKRVARGDRFVRSGKNTFGLKGGKP